MRTAKLTVEDTSSGWDWQIEFDDGTYLGHRGYEGSEAKAVEVGLLWLRTYLKKGVKVETNLGLKERQAHLAELAEILDPRGTRFDWNWTMLYNPDRMGIVDGNNLSIIARTRTTETDDEWAIIIDRFKHIVNCANAAEPLISEAEIKEVCNEV